MITIIVNGKIKLHTRGGKDRRDGTATQDRNS